LGEKTVEEAKKIAEQYGKSLRTILIQAGLSVKPTQAENGWNMYQAWYTVQFPKSPDSESCVVSVDYFTYTILSSIYK
jgi:hypothetical protein